jgi:hypothetical protein
MGKRARRLVLLVPAGAVALLAAACGPTPPPPNTDYQFRDYSAAFGTPLGCANADGPDLFRLGTPGGTSVEGVVEGVDGVSEHVWQFSKGVGLGLGPTTGEANNDAYSVVMLFRLSEIGGFDRLIDLKSGTAESGLHLYNGQLNFWRTTASNSFFGSKVIANNEYAQVVLTRAADGTVAGYVDGIRQWQFSDTTGEALISSQNTLRFFQDNAGGSEHSAGAVARIRVFDRPLTATEVSNLGQTPGSPCAT